MRKEIDKEVCTFEDVKVMSRKKKNNGLFIPIAHVRDLSLGSILDFAQHYEFFCVVAFGEYVSSTCSDLIDFSIKLHVLRVSHL